MTEHSPLRQQKILVTGATGFIGGRLVEYLVLHFQTQVRALVRNCGRATRLARLPVQLILGDLLDIDSLQKAVAECDIVFHCAYGAVGDDDNRRQVTVEGTTNLLAAAKAAGVKRFVHVSTIAVHGPDPGPVVDENSPLIYTGDVYGDAKIDAEKQVMHYYHEHNLPVVILRPTIVYGPRAGGWTVGPVNAIQHSNLALIDGGQGMANHVYVDDVVQALLLAATTTKALGEAFVISYGQGVTWQEFYGHYACMMGATLPILPVETINQQRKHLSQLQHPLNRGLSFVASPHAQSIIRELPGVGMSLDLVSKLFPAHLKKATMAHAQAMRQTKLNPPTPPRQWLVDLFCAKGICKIDKAQAQLGYQPAISLTEGMALTEAWLRDTGII